MYKFLADATEQTADAEEDEEEAEPCAGEEEEEEEEEKAEDLVALEEPKECLPDGYVHPKEWQEFLDDAKLEDPTRYIDLVDETDRACGALRTFVNSADEEIAGYMEILKETDPKMHERIVALKNMTDPNHAVNALAEALGSPPDQADWKEKERQDSTCEM